MINIDTFYKVSYGLYLVSAKYQDIKAGYIANTVFQVTARPPKFGISCNKDNFSAEIIKKSGAFAFSVLGEQASTGLIGDFGYRSSREIDKFRGVNYFIGETGSPIITDSSLAWFDCKITETIDVGSHLLFIGEAIASELIKSDIKPLTYNYYREVMKGFSPKNAPTYIEKAAIAEVTDKDSENELWQCQLCHYTYESEKGDPISGIDPGTKFEDLPEDWCCPICGADKSMFERD
ncbi:MAG TPA: flavin reductase [Prolixibacteraceae bacterium]|nr:flavin reductase [Prolixibacteraceae bacterium]